MAKFQVPKNTTSKILRLFIQDSSVSTGAGLTGLVFNTANLVAYYSREGDAAETAITLVTATEGTYTSSGFIEMDATDLPGVYELGIPDAAIASGVNSVLVMLHGAANMAPLVLEIELIDQIVAPQHINLGLLKQSTNVHRLIGPVIDIDTGAPKTSLTLGNITAARVVQTTTVTRTALTLAASGDNQFTHVGDGYWQLDLTATDTGTLGHLAITIRDDDLFHPIVATAMVVPANIYDSLVAGSDTIDASVTQWLGTAVTAATAGIPNVNMKEVDGSSANATAFSGSIDAINNLVKTDVIRLSGDSGAADNAESFFDGTGYAGGTAKLTVDVTAISGDSTAADRLEALMDTSTIFTVDDSGFSPTTTQFETSAGDATDDHYNNREIIWITGNLAASRYAVSDYAGGTNRWTVPTMTDTPANGDTFQIV